VNSLRDWRGGLSSAQVALLLVPLLVGMLMAMTSCTISEITLYKTVNNPVVSATPSSE